MVAVTAIQLSLTSVTAANYDRGSNENAVTTNYGHGEK